MSLPLPDLDDRSFDDLMKEVQSLIPIYNKEWTNFNPSDPGITLLELFAWLSEMVIYRTNQVTEENYRKFLELIGIELDTDESIASGISRGLESISGRYRAITSGDYEFLANERMKTLEEGLECRTICVNNRDLEFSKPDKKKPGNVSVIIIPGCREDSVYCNDGLPTNELKDEIKEYLDSRRLITTRVHVVEPDYQTVTLDIEIALEENTDENSVTNKAIDRIRTYFDPVKGGQEGKGWPLGRDLYRPEIYQLLEGVPGIDHVVDIIIRVDDVGVEYVTIEEYELVLIADPVVIKVYHE
jgi:hypothetical protein